MRLSTIPNLDLSYVTNPANFAAIKAKWPTRELFVLGGQQEMIDLLGNATAAERASVEKILNNVTNRIYGISVLGVTLPSWWPYAAGGAGLLVVILLLTRKH